MPYFYTFCHRSEHILSATTGVIGKCAAWLTVIMAVVTTAIVVIRALFDVGSIGAQESLTYMHALVIMLTSAYTLKEGGHVRVDIFYRNFSSLQKAWVDALGSILFLLPLAIFTILISWDYVAVSWAVTETSADAGGVPAVFLLKTLLLIGGGLLALQALAEAARALITLTYDS